MRNLFDKRLIEVTELELLQLRANQVLSAVTYLAARLVLAGIALAGIWLCAQAKLWPYARHRLARDFLRCQLRSSLLRIRLPYLLMTKAVMPVRAVVITAYAASVTCASPLSEQTGLC